jgi:hypothetical protein
MECLRRALPCFFHGLGGGKVLEKKKDGNRPKSPSVHKES